MKVFEDLTNGLETGTPAPDFHIADKLMLSDLKGFPILLVFWKTL